MKKPRSSPLALAVLGLLFEEPMHPYRMHRLIEQRGKDEVVNVRRRASLYQIIERLERAGLIAARETIKDPNRPERTVYEITDAGREITVAWLREMLGDPVREFPIFPAALAYLPMLTTEDARAQLERRIAALGQELERLTGLHQSALPDIPRLFLIETEYAVAMLRAEIAWVSGLVGDLRSGKLAWDQAWLRSMAARFQPDAEP